MFGADNKIYALCGQTTDEHSPNVTFANYTIDNFDCYDLKKKKWSEVKASGLDFPYTISEFTLLPIYDDVNEGVDVGKGEEPTDPVAIIVFGGYVEIDKRYGLPNNETLMELYGKDWQEFGTVPYCNRMLRYDIASQTWTRLKPLKRNNHLAQMFAAIIKSDDGRMDVLMGGGYGLSEGCRGGVDEELNLPSSDARRWETETMLNDISRVQKDFNKDRMLNPSKSDTTYIVSIADFDGTTIESRKENWAWEFYTSKETDIPRCDTFFSSSSPTLHYVCDLSSEDFRKSPSIIDDSVVQPNAESRLLGVRLMLHGLKGSSHLNGQVGRCGYWEPHYERYTIYLHSYEPNGPKSVMAKPFNLSIAAPYTAVDVKNHLSLFASQNCRFPNVSLMAIVPSTTENIPPLQYFLENRFDDTQKNCGTLMDQYHGPVSPRSQVALRDVCEKIDGCTDLFGLVLCPDKICKDKKKCKKLQKYREFCLQMQKDDHTKVKQFEYDIISSTTEESLVDQLGWLKLVITLDGIVPEIRRVSQIAGSISSFSFFFFRITHKLFLLVFITYYLSCNATYFFVILPRLYLFNTTDKKEIMISPDLTMQNLYHQVLCPSIGWTKNYHCYGFRRLNDECWIGPKKSTAIDSMFQPFFMGAVLANDKKITIGQLFSSDTDTNTDTDTDTDTKTTSIQFVHDLGDWWSHTIQVSKFSGTVPPSATVAYLLSGRGGCPPEDTGGIRNYSLLMNKLTSRVPIDENCADPSDESWWNLLNEEIRAKSNYVNYFGSPLDFNISTTRSKLDAAIRSRTQKVGKESANHLMNRQELGVVSELCDSDPSMVTKKPNDKTKFCTVCGVTVALKLCGGCNSIAYCSRDHQLEAWPSHKVECKRIQKIQKRKKK